jgi:DeoR family suf operon transcriptional repressor
MDQKLLHEDDVKTTRERVLKTLLIKEKCTIVDLADAVDINPISVRHHINKLEAEGLVSSVEEKRGVGRPRRLYHLSEKGREFFPTRYLRLTIRLLEQLKETLPKNIVDSLFSQMAKDIAAEYGDLIEGLDFEERLNLVTRLLNQEGFSVDWQKKEDEYFIREINCPYYHIGQSHPEICSVDKTLIATMLSVPVEKVKCILNGDSNCTYAVSNTYQTEKSS